MIDRLCIAARLVIVGALFIGLGWVAFWGFVAAAGWLIQFAKFVFGG